MTDDLAPMALRYAVAGLPVLPLHSIRNGRCTCGRNCATPAKHPLARLVPRGLSQATTNPDTIREWLTQEPYANIGIRPPPG